MSEQFTFESDSDRPPIYEMIEAILNNDTAAIEKFKQQLAALRAKHPEKISERKKNKGQKDKENPTP